MSILANKISEFVYTYNMIGTKTIIIYNKREKSLKVLTKDSIIISNIFIVVDLNYKDFIIQSKLIYKKTLEQLDYQILDYTKH